MKLTILGTGNALVTKCYNTCFVLSDEDRHLLVDGGGGSEILARLEKAEIDWRDIKDIFVTHKHIDHLLGIIWMIRIITQNMAKGKYDGEVNLYAHEEVIEILQNMANTLLVKKTTKFIGDRFHMITVKDGESRDIIGHKVTFFDIQSTKAKQFGFSMDLGDAGKLTCCGDEPYCDYEEPYAKDSTWLLHEAFCLYSHADIFSPYEKHHSTVKDACELAQSLNVKNLILYHTEDKNIENRKELYMQEGRPYFNGNLYVPDDMEIIEL